MKVFFGTKKLGKLDNEVTSNEKYPERAVVTLEEDRGHGKTRRILFNEKAMELLNLVEGDHQSVMFGTIFLDDNNERKLLISNVDNLNDTEDLTIYKVSKNKVGFNSTKEKGKSISNGSLTKEIIDFLEKSEEGFYEFELSEFDMGESEIEAFVFSELIEENPEEETTDGSGEEETSEAELNSNSYETKEHEGIEGEEVEEAYKPANYFNQQNQHNPQNVDDKEYV